MKRIKLSLCLLLVLTACRRDMYNQPRYKTYAKDDFFQDGASARSLPPHTVARGQRPPPPAVPPAFQTPPSIRKWRNPVS